MPVSRALAALAPVALGLAWPVSPAAGAGGWAWPVDGPVITPYANGSDPYARGQHRGIDIGAAAGTPVLAAAPGTVRFAGTVGSSGRTVSVRTADGRFDTSYLHLSSLSVRGGERVAAGARLGAVGTTGRRSAVVPHVHFGVRDAGSRHAYRDPFTLLAPPGARPAPRGAPAPEAVPVRRVPSPVRVPGGAPRVRFAPNPRPLRVPAGRRVRVPAGRRVWVPAGRRVRVPVGRRAPLPEPLPGRERAAAPGLVPHSGPAGVPSPHSGFERAGTGAREGPGGAIPGWVLPLAGLLLAVACLGAGRPVRSPGPTVGASSIGRCALLRHHAHLLRERRAPPRARLHHRGG